MWLTLSLEFGPSAPPGQHDPFALDRADVGLSRANNSHFIHPVFRLYREASCASSDGACEPVDELHIVEDFLAEWRLHRAHILPLSRFLQDVGARRLRGDSMALWPPPPLRRPPAFLGGVLAQLAGGCECATLHFRGAAHDIGGGGGEGWWLTLSVAAERALHRLRALAVHAVDGAPGVQLSAEEAAHTQSVREKWAAARAGARVIPDEAPRPQSPPANAPAALSARAEAFGAYGALTRDDHSLAVLVVDARTGYCRVLTERLGVDVNAVKVFEPTGADGSKGSSIDIKARPVTAEHAAKLVKHVFLKRKTAEHTTMT
jgi:hypothetical protein